MSQIPDRSQTGIIIEVIEDSELIRTEKIVPSKNLYLYKLFLFLLKCMRSQIILTKDKYKEFKQIIMDED